MSRGLTVLLVEQKLDFIEALVDSTFVIQRGKITGSISNEDLADASVVNEFVGLGQHQPQSGLASGHALLNGSAP